MKLEERACGTPCIASETGKRKSKGKGKRNEQGKQTSEITRRRSPDTWKWNKRRRKEEMRVLTYWHFGKFQIGEKSCDQSWKKKTTLDNLPSTLHILPSTLDNILSTLYILPSTPDPRQKTTLVLFQSALYALLKNGSIITRFCNTRAK